MIPESQHIPSQKVQPNLALSFTTLNSSSPNLEQYLINLAVFISRQPRFVKTPETEQDSLINNIGLRLRDNISNGRNITIANTNEGSIIGYLISKQTGEFRSSWLADVYDIAQSGIPPKTIYKHMIQPQLPSFQISGNKAEGWDLSGTFKFLFSYYESNQDARGNIGLLMIAEVDPSVRKLGISKLLLTQVLEEFRQKGTFLVFTFARCAQMNQWEPDAVKAQERLQEYVALRDEKGLHPDYGIRFHQKAGGQIICGIPHCAQDPEAHDHMCFMIYRL